MATSSRPVHRSHEPGASAFSAETRFRAVIEKCLGAALFFDSGGTVRGATPSGARLLGYEPGELDGTDGFEHIHPEDRDRIRRALTALVATPDATHTEVYRGCHKDGSWCWLEARAVNLLFEAGVGALVVTYRDVTAQQRQDEERRQTARQEATRELASGVASDLNNLLTIVNGYSELALAELRSDDQVRQMVEGIKAAGSRAAVITGQLLALSRRPISQPGIVFLNAVVSDVARMARRLVGDDIEVVAPLNDRPLRIHADREQMEQVLVNLVVNARDAMPTGGALTIETRKEVLGPGAKGTDGAEVRPGLYARVAVSDTGTGMTEDVKNRIFEPFFTTKEVGKGTGLGLAIAHGVVKHWGGHIEVETVLGRGTTFCIYLPVFGATDISRDAGERSTANGPEVVLMVADESADRP
ncbi:Blue-light-activated protein [Gemmata sp. SH-PL17]|uniref:two-component system sensor histidine kinase NtrB n=1 Tax=Gemmata sp. SH-PL17 TaxID=1630693 RepID=UPI00078E9C29|nr:ATP-binding protein [Gemmata sp. SH-PL17]AMV29404.1 Blue-light-activated protein [Gemmata sp. SH-PL17]